MKFENAIQLTEELEERYKDDLNNILKLNFASDLLYEIHDYIPIFKIGHMTYGTSFWVFTRPTDLVAEAMHMATIEELEEELEVRKLMEKKSGKEETK